MMKRSHHSMTGILLVLTITLLIVLSTGGNAEALKLSRHDGGFFTIDKPHGWQILTAGQCSTFAFLIRDPSRPERQIFHFGEVGPVYTAAQQKQIDMQYMRMGGYPIQWIEMPVVQPLTPERFLQRFHLIARTRIAHSFMPQCPHLDGFTVISTQARPCPIPGGSTAMVRALFRQNGTVVEGLFTATVAPMLPFNGNPGSGIGYGFLVTGITAPHREFTKLQKDMTRSVASFTIRQNYVNQCLRQQAATYAGIMRAGKTLSETSDMIMEGWQTRNKTHDIIAEKRSDGILGRERLYNPDTGDVYEFENGFYDSYDINRQRYEMSNLAPLPDGDYDLWMKAPLDGSRNLR